MADKEKANSEFRKNYAALKKALVRLQNDPREDVSTQGQLVFDIGELQAQGDNGVGLSLEDAVRAAAVYGGILETDKRTDLRSEWDRNSVMSYLSHEVLKALRREGIPLIDPVSGEVVTIHPSLLSHKSRQVDSLPEPKKAALDARLNNGDLPVGGSSVATTVIGPEEYIPIMDRMVQGQLVEDAPKADSKKIRNTSFLRALRGFPWKRLLASGALAFGLYQWNGSPIHDRYDQISNPVGYAARIRQEKEKWEFAHALTTEWTVKPYTSKWQVSYPVDANDYVFTPFYKDDRKNMIVRAGELINIGDIHNVYRDLTNSSFDTKISAYPYTDIDGKIIPKLSIGGYFHESEYLLNGDKTAPEGSSANQRPDVAEFYSESYQRCKLTHPVCNPKVLTLVSD